LKTGDLAEIIIDRVAFGGDGIGRLGDLVVFVPYTVDGDVVRVEIAEIRKRYARGRLKEILQPSVHRTKPLCEDYTRCGGCCYQHIAYEHQLLLKENQVMDAFQRIGKLPSPPLRPVIASPHPYHYRLKADFHVNAQKGKTPALGLMSGSSNRIIGIKRCEIVDESINRRYGELKGELQSGKRVPTTDRVTLWSDDGNENGKDGAVDVTTTTTRMITRTVKDRRLTAPYEGFFQANQYLISEMIDRVVAAADLTGEETVIDGFCGSGLFSLFLAPLAKVVHGIEGNGRAIRAARENLDRHGCHNVSLYQGDVGEGLGKAFLNPPAPVDVLVIDPPRVGCEEDLLEKTIRLGLERIVYVSCNPATQARDIHLLCAGGFRLEFLQPLDMFPQTAHIEVIALLTR
jgi:23S rRNA (uracil1939-C5)-methyltransferase